MSEAEIRQRIEEARRFLAEGDLRAIVDTAPRLSYLAGQTAIRAGGSVTLRVAVQEAARRAERALGVAIRDGRLVVPPSSHNRRREITLDGETLREVHHGYLTDAIYPLVDGVTDLAFEDAIEKSRAIGDLSRDTLVELIHTGRSTRLRRVVVAEDDPDRLALIAEMATAGNSSTQIGRRLGLGPETVRRLARQAEIVIPADAVNRRKARVDHTRLLRHTVEVLEGLTDMAACPTPTHYGSVTLGRTPPQDPEGE